MGYELLDNDLTDSTLWLFGSKDAKILFVTILSKCHGSEVVRTPVTVLVKLAGLTKEEGDAAMRELEGPDPDSKCPSDDGRRVVRFEDDKGRGLRLPSYKSRRNRYLTRERMVAYRGKTDGIVAFGDEVLRSVTPRDDKFALEQSRAEAEPEQKQSKPERERERFAPPSLEEVVEYGKEIPGLNASAFHDFYSSKGWKIGSSSMKDWRAAARRWRRRDVEEGKVSTPSAQHDERAAARKADADKWAEMQATVARELAEDAAERKAHGL